MNGKHFCKYKNKKKGVTQTVLVMMILILVGGAIVLVLFSVFFEDVKETSVDNMCAFSTFLKGKLTISFGSFVLFTIPDFCTPRGVSIDPDDNSACPGNENNPEDCAAQQIADLALRCWEMRGAGKYNLCDFECFDFFLKESNRQNIVITQQDIKYVIENTNVPGKDYKFSKRLPNGNQFQIKSISPSDSSYGVCYVDIGEGGLGVIPRLERLFKNVSGDAIFIGGDCESELRGRCS